MSKKHAMTVLGPVASSELGTTLTHEHLLFDQIDYVRGPVDAEAARFDDAMVEMRHLGALRRRPGLIPDNGRNTDPELASREMKLFKQAGGGTVVEVSSRGLGRDALGLKRIAESSGVNIIAGCGYYKVAGHPPDMAERSVVDVTAEIVRELESGIGDTGIRAGVIGEIATGSPLYDVPLDVWDLRDHVDMVPAEEKVLRAAGRASIVTGAPVSVHIYHYRPNRLAHHVLDILSSEGTDLERVAICHLDTRPDPDYVASVADRGAFVEFDTFGMEQYNDMTLSQAIRDTERIKLVVDTVERGYADHILLSHDVCWKMLMVEYGGWGYAHLSKHIEPRLLAAGVSADDIHAMRVANPARWLAY